MPRRLDSTVRERRILEAVRAVFAEELQWRLSTPQGARGSEDATTINIQKAKVFFRDEMVVMRHQLLDVPDYDLSPPAYELCLTTLSDLLRFLETLVRDEILESPESLSEQPEVCRTLHNKVTHALKVSRRAKTLYRKPQRRLLFQLRFLTSSQDGYPKFRTSGLGHCHPTPPKRP